MKNKNYIVFFIMIILVQFSFGQEKSTKLSTRPATQNTTSLSEITKESKTRMLKVLEGLKFSTTKSEVDRISTVFKNIKNHPDYAEDKWDARYDAVAKIFLTPEGTLSLVWPVFLFFLIIWFIKRFYAVFIEPADYMISEG